MKKHYKFTAVVTREGKWYVAECPELGVASQGRTIESALKNLNEAVTLYLREEKSAKSEALSHPPIVTVLEIAV